MPFIDLSSANSNPNQDSNLNPNPQNNPVAAGNDLSNPQQTINDMPSASQAVNISDFPTAPQLAGQQVPTTQTISSPTEQIADYPVGELNSLNIAAVDTQISPGLSGSVNSANPQAIEVSIDQDEVKTITGPQLAYTPQPQQTYAPEPQQARLGDGSATVSSAQNMTENTAQPISTTNQVPNQLSDGLTSIPQSTSVTQTEPSQQIISSGENIQTPTAQYGNLQNNMANSQQFIQPTQLAQEVSTGVQVSTGLLPADSSLQQIMEAADKLDASDIHFTANYPVMVRVHGSLQQITDTISPEQSANLALSLLTEEQKKVYVSEKELDFSFTSEANVRFRVNLFIERGNHAGAMRLIAKRIRTLDELELPQIFSELIEEPQGLILLVGPTGSGKSTTLAAMLNQINMTRREHIITIEDPIEYVYPVGMSIVGQRELGSDTKSWDSALRSALREDPDVVLVGEMRDLSTIESTITIAETGHLVFATLHTNSAAQAVDRIIDVFPEGAKEQIRAQLANVLTAVISQRLIPVQQGGRRAAIEVMLGTVAVKNAIREGKTYQIDNIIQTSGDLGMITLEKSLVEMVKKGYLTIEEAKANSTKPDEVDALYRKSM